MKEEAWLAANTGYCKPLHARITRAQCSANKGSGLCNCKGCDGLAAQGPNAGPKPKEIREKTMAKKTKTTKYGDCACCGRHLAIQTGGLCGTCYKLQRAGHVVQNAEGWTMDAVAKKKIDWLRQAEQEAQDCVVETSGTADIFDIEIDGVRFEVLEHANQSLVEPTLTVLKDRGLALNRAAQKIYKLDEYTHLRLAVNSSAGLLALEFCGPEAAGARRINNNGGRNFRVGASQAVRELGLAGRYPLEQAREGVLLVRIGQRAA